MRAVELRLERQYHVPRAKPPKAISPIRAMISPIQKLQTIISTIPMITRMPPSEIPPTPAPLSALLFICSSVRWLMDECFEPTGTQEGGDLLRLRRFLTRPAAGELGERGAAAVVDQPFDQAE